MARICRDDLPDGLNEIFLQRGLDNPNQIETKGEFFLWAHQRVVRMRARQAPREPGMTSYSISTEAKNSSAFSRVGK